MYLGALPLIQLKEQTMGFGNMNGEPPPIDPYNPLPPLTPTEKHAVHELVLCIENDNTLSPNAPSGAGRDLAQRYVVKRRDNKSWKTEVALNRWRRIVDEAVRRYMLAFPDTERDYFTEDVRVTATSEIHAAFESELKLGEFDHL